MSKPIAVLISDIHYNLNNLKLADAAMRMAIVKANDLDVPLIVAGDLHDTKANLRGECVNTMISTFMAAKITPIVLVGNHCRINEKSSEHSLNFLNKYAFVLSTSYESEKFNNMWFIPYYHSPEELRTYLKTIPKGSTIIMHQGISGSNSGEYIQDKSAITKDDVKGMRVISGHYHARQTIALPDGGSWDYIGNPYTTNYGEANDPPKGFQILMDDGRLEFIPTNLRKHVVKDISVGVPFDEIAMTPTNPEDLVWIKLRGTKEQLSKYNKEFVAKMCEITGSFKLDLIPLDTVSQVNAPQNLTQSELLDQLIDSLTHTSDETKNRLKQTWKGLI